jgi:hypothetical protein
VTSSLRLSPYFSTDGPEQAVRTMARQQFWTSIIGLPPEKWSSLRYGFEPEGGHFNGEEEAQCGRDCCQVAAG